MKGVLTVALVDPQDNTRERLKDVLLAMDTVWLDAECSRLDSAEDIIEQTRPDVAIVGLEPEPERAFALVAHLTAAQPDCAVLVTSEGEDAQSILRSMRAGAKEFLKRPVAAEVLADAIARLSLSNRKDDQAEATTSEVITVAGAGGGVGTTTLAVNLGCALARVPNASAVLVDLDLALGDADVCLDLLPEYTLADVTTNISRLDVQLLKRSLTKHSSGLFLLPRPSEMQEAGTINGSHVQRIVGLLKAVFRYVVIDTSKAFQGPGLTAMDLADDILLLTQLDLPCLRNAVRVLMMLGRREGMGDKVHVVLNRLGLEDGEISIRKAEQTIGRGVTWRIPNDWFTVNGARNTGAPLHLFAPKSKVAQAIADVATHWHTPAEVPATRRRGLFSFLS